MTFVESHIRCKGERRTVADMEATKILYAFRLDKQLETSVKEMKKTERAYYWALLVKGPDDEDLPESLMLEDSVPCIYEEDGELKYVIRYPSLSTESK